MNPLKVKLFDVRSCDIGELFKFKLNSIKEFLSEEEKDIFVSGFVTTITT